MSNRTNCTLYASCAFSGAERDDGTFEDGWLLLIMYKWIVDNFCQIEIMGSTGDYGDVVTICGRDDGSAFAAMVGALDWSEHDARSVVLILHGDYHDYPVIWRFDADGQWSAS